MFLCESARVGTRDAADVPWRAVSFLPYILYTPMCFVCLKTDYSFLWTAFLAVTMATASST
jgi:hypothetical protein